MRLKRVSFLAALIFAWVAGAVSADPPEGYYRQPALHTNTVVFVSEGDLWRVDIKGGQATRLTSHAGSEALPAISPDGKSVAFTASYEGPTDVYSMPVQGGQPRRWTFGASRVTYVGWTPDGKILYSTRSYSTLPNNQLVTIDCQSGGRKLVPLAQAADGCYDDNGKTLFFTRLPFQGSHTKRYKGGTAQNLWRFGAGDDEAAPLTANYPGTSKRPMWWGGRVYFVSDRDGTMNLWSMSPDGNDLKQHTRHSGWDVTSPSLSAGRIVYKLGADLYVHDIAGKKDRKLSITLSSDFDQLREKWIDEPTKYLSAAHIAADGKRVVLTARGQVFVAPVDQGRLVQVTRANGVRHRNARFLDEKRLLTLSDQSGEVELWTLPANGIGKAKQLTDDGDVLRWEARPSPDGKWIAHRGKNQRLFLFDVKDKKNKKIDFSEVDEITDVRWSPDSRWLAYVKTADNMFARLWLYSLDDGKITPLTTDRYGSYSPAWSPDGKWIYFLSDRNLKSVVPSPWGTYQPEPFLDKKTKIYQIPLQKGLRSPFAANDELHDDEEPKKKKDDKKDGKKPKLTVKIDREEIHTRLLELPISPGNYDNLSVNDKGLFWTSTTTDRKSTSLTGAAIARKKVSARTIVKDIKSYELAQNGKSILIRKGDDLYVIDAMPKPADLAKKKVNLSAWKLSIIPRQEWRQMFIEAWRLERDYFYDRGLHSVDWQAMRGKYLPLVDRVRSRDELSDLVAQLVSELSALHIFVRGGDLREGRDKVMPASLGAVLQRDDNAGGYRVEHIYKTDPDEPKRRSPLAHPQVNVKQGDIIDMVDGAPALSAPHIGMLLRHKAGRQVLLRIKPAGGGKRREVIVNPISMTSEEDLRYHEWEYTRRLRVEEQSDKQIGYVHLRAMGGRNFTEWAKNFYPVFNRPGLIIDVRNNRGGNIDSWILSRLLRKAWFHWNQRVGKAPMWNMQYAFRGHIVVLCNEYTASDGEAFSEGIKRLKLGKVIGTRTWGGEIWLTSSNFLVDRGIATAAEFGVYGPEGVWLIEGHGVEPDMVVDNLPHATFNGKDAQLDAAIRYLHEQIEKHPVPIPPVPKFPNKRFPYRRQGQLKDATPQPTTPKSESKDKQEQAMNYVPKKMAAAVVASVLLASSLQAGGKVTILPDEVYGHKFGLAMTMDVFKPKKANGAGVLFMVSGGWYSRWQPPKNSLPLFQPLLDKGFTVFAVRHGSSPKFGIPEIVEDVRRSVRFVRLNAKKYGVDPERLGVFGGSAGGHLSLMLGTASDKGFPKNKDKLMQQSTRVAAVVALFPPTDLRHVVWEAKDADKQYRRFPALDLSVKKAAVVSPLLHVTKDDPPTLLIHGDKDKLVPIKHSNDILAAFKDKGVACELLVIKGAGHGFAGKDAIITRDALVRWFERYLLKKEG